MDMVKDELIEKDRLLAVQEGLIGFLLDEVVDPAGKHHYDGHIIDVQAYKK
jgi:hypothetical protein